MQPDSDSLLFTRRRLLAWAVGANALCSRGYAFASDFWNKKGPADWSADEVHQLLTKSPWAKQVTAEVTRSGGGAPRNPSSGGNGGMGNGGLGGGNNRGAGGLGGSGSSRGGMGGTNTNRNAGDMGSTSSTPRPSGQQFKGIVRWESAKPVMEAAKTPIPDPMADHYIISVINFPLNAKRSDSDDGPPKLSKAAVEKIKAATSLTVKGKDAARPDVVQVVGLTLLLGFTKESVHLAPDDKEVAFATLIGRMNIKTKFNLKEMMYHEALAI